MKKIIRVLIVVLAFILVFAFAGCNATRGTQEELTYQALYNNAVELGYEGTLDEFIALLKGDKGDKGNDGEPGEKGNDGLSAYEIYIKYHPEYEGNEEQWMDDLVNGRLADKKADVLSEDTMDEIKLSYKNFLYNKQNVNIEHLNVFYYGTYSGNIVVMVAYKYDSRTLSDFYRYEEHRETITISDIEFDVYQYFNRIYVWDGSFGTIEFYADRGKLTKKDIQKIADTHNAALPIMYFPDWPDYYVGSVRVTISEEYREKIEAKEFTVEDFQWENVKEITYISWYDFMGYGVIEMDLKKRGEEYLIATMEHFKTLDFVRTVEKVSANLGVATLTS